MELQIVLLVAALAATILLLAGYLYVVRGRIHALERERDQLRHDQGAESTRR